MSDASTPAVLIAGARKAFQPNPFRPPKVAVADVSIEVPQGAVHGVLGPNGAGKTTTLKMLLGLVRPTAGRFEVLGRPSREPVSRRELGFLPEQPYFPVQLTALQAMRLYARLSGLPEGEIKGRVYELLDVVGLAGEERTRLNAFSRGMLQRLGIAQAIVGRPRVVVLDEPASGLDPVGQRDVRAIMTRLRDEGVTVLLSSHQLSEVEAVCDRVTIVDRGEVSAEGRIDDLLRVVGRTSVRASMPSPVLPEPVRALAEDVAVDAGVAVFSVADGDVRRVVDAVDDAGGRVLALVPKRESLEDYFARMLDRAKEAVR